MLLETKANPFAKALSPDSTDTSFASKIPTLTEPTGSGVVSFKVGGIAPNAVTLVPYGTGANNDTMSVRLIGWRGLGSGNSALWIPVVLVELSVTLSAVVGVTGGLIVSTERFADTMTLTTGNDDISIDLVSPTGDVIAHAVCDLKGFQKFEISVKCTGTTTAANCLYSLH